MFEISQSRFTNNSAEVSGGALALNRPLLGLSILRLHHSAIANNTAGVEGGGCSFQAAANVVFDRTAVVHNKAGRGAGVVCRSCDIVAFDVYREKLLDRPQEVQQMWAMGYSNKLLTWLDRLAGGRHDDGLGVSILYKNSATHKGGGLLCENCG